MSWRTPLVATALILTLSCLNPQGLCAQGRRCDPSTGRIRILYFGDAFAGPSPYPVYARDPLTTIVPIMASGFHYPPSIIKRHMRTYMPRTEAKLSEGYDVIVISDANTQSFRSDYLLWFHQGIVEDGLGLVMIGGLETFGAVPNYPGSWGETPVANVLPVECLPERWEKRDGRLEVEEPADAFMEALPFETMGNFGIFHGCNIVAERQGVRPLASYKVLSAPDVYPLLAYWEVGQGRAFAETADWTPAGGTNFLRWPYYADYALNVAILSTGGAVPADVALAHRARKLIQDYHGQRQTLESIMEFASKFGANMAPAERIVGKAESLRASGESYYLEGEMIDAIEALSDALDRLGAAAERAYDLRDEAMAWVYLTEWLVVASTGMLCALLLWAIMIRRKIYREVGETKLISRWA